jgi:hypothetical protein
VSRVSRVSKNERGSAGRPRVSEGKKGEHGKQGEEMKQGKQSERGSAR